MSLCHFFFPLSLFRKYASFVDVTWFTVHRLSECQFRAALHKQALPKSVGSTSRWYVSQAGGGKWSIADSCPSPDITFAELIILSLLLALPTLFLTRRPFYTCSNLPADWLVQAPLFPSRKVRSLGRSGDPPKRRPPPFLVSTWYALFRCHDTDAKFRPAVLNLLGCFGRLLSARSRDWRTLKGMLSPVLLLSLV